MQLPTTAPPIRLSGDTASAQYTTFSLAGADTNYRLSNGGYTGTAGHSLASTIEMPFSTTDRDNDIHGKTKQVHKQLGCFF